MVKLFLISVQAEVHSEYGMQVFPRSSPQSVSGVFQYAIALKYAGSVTW